MACPNINLNSWKNLVAARGEDVAYYLWDRYEGEVPQEEYISSTQDNINKSFFQLDRSKLPAAQKKLDNQLLSFLSQFGVTSKEIDNFKERFGIDALGATDVMQKLIYLSSRRNITTIPEEAAHMMVMLMGKDHPLIIESFNNIEKWSGYENIKKQYMPIYKDENKVKVEALGHLIRDAIINKYTSNNSVEKSLFQKIKELVENFLKGIRTKFGVKKNDELVYDKQAVMKIAEGMLSGDSSMVTSQRSFKYSTNVDYYKALEKDPLSKSIVNKYTEKLPFKLTGSLAIAKQTNIERWHGEQIHDLDFKVGQDWINKNGEEAFDKLLDKPNIIKIREIYNENSSYHTKSYLEAPEGYRIEKRRDTISSSSPMMDIDVYDEKGNKLSTIDAIDKVKSLDFFIGGNEETSFENVASWQDVFQGKLSLSALGENEVMFDRAKDQTDYINVTPVNLQESKTKNLYFQTESMSASKASPELVEKIKALAKKMGVSIQGLAEYAKQRGLDVGGVNGVADMVRNIIAVAEGKEDVAITEELVHMATAMLEQSRPDIITSMISKIDRFKIYKLVLEKYKNNKNYQLPNGKPDIRKIKKEAVDKLITELIVRDAQDTTDFPELLQEEQRSFVQKLWDAIKDVVRMMYTSSNINIFEETAATIMAGEISPEAFERAKAEGKIADELFLQIEKNDAVDGIYDTVMSEHGKMKLDPGEVDASGKVIRKRGYTYDGQEVAKSVTQKIKEDVKMPDRTGLLKEQDEQKRAWGDKGHTYIKNFISANLIDENGYARTTPLNNRIATNLNDDIREKLDAFSKELINSYPKGTRFVIEKMVINKKAKGMIGSTVDFMAIEPITKADGTKDAKVDVLDWKFTSINKSVADDIPWYKQKEWKAQMGEYSKIMYNYGVKPTQLRKTRMVPFQSNYLYAIPGDPSSGLVLTSIEIGKLDNIEETNLYLLPVPLNTESTGNEKVDRLIASLRRWHEKLYKTVVSEEQKATKNIQLNQISTAIRKLHLQLDFAPLASVGVTFLNNAKETLNSFENIDYTKLSAEELRKKLGDLLEYQKSAEKFSNLDDVFLSYVSKEGMTEEDKNVLNSLEKVAASTERMVDRITAVQREFVIQLALKERITTEATKETILDAEKEVGTFTKTFLEASKLPNKIIKLAANLLMNAKSLVERRINKLVDEYSKVLLPVEEEAKAKGVSAFDLIGRVEDGDLKLIKKIDPKFYKAYNDAIAKKDKAFFLENLDIDKYNALMEEFLNKSVETINNTEFSPNESDDIARKKFEIEKLRNSVNINLSTFNGYNDYNFRRLFRQAMLEEKNYSEDYKNMSPAAKDLWDFMVALNQKAINMGYLKDRGLSFFPLMEASAIHRLMQSDSLLTEGKDLFKDGYTAKINERQGLSKIDVETGQVERTIPRLFTRTDKDVKQLSKDLTHVGTLWIKSLLDRRKNK